MASSPWPPGPLNQQAQHSYSNQDSLYHQQPYHHRYHPSVSSVLETSSASGTPPSGTPSRGRADTSSSPASRPQSPSSQIRSRAVSSASSTYSTASAVRRKPLPLSASQRVLRSPEPIPLESTLEKPEDVFARQYALDSPTLYEFPASSAVPFAPASSTKNRHSR